MKRLAKLIVNTITILLILIIVASLYSMLQYKRNPDKLPAVLGYSTMSVLTGSMRPYLEPGDMIVDKAVNAEAVKVGDVLTYKVDNAIITHRVTKIVPKEGKLFFETRGDANNVEDSSLVGEDQIVGKVLFRIPYGGYIARFIRSPFGLFILVAVLILPMLVGELMKAILSGGKTEKYKKSETEGSVHIN